MIQYTFAPIQFTIITHSFTLRTHSGECLMCSFVDTSLCAFHKQFSFHRLFSAILLFYPFVFSILLASLFHVSPRANSPSSHPAIPYKLYDNNLVVCKRVRCHVIRHPFVFVFVRGCAAKDGGKTPDAILDCSLMKRRKCISENEKKTNTRSANTLEMERVGVGHNEHSFGPNVL